MDSYLQLSPDSSTPHTPSPRSSLDLDDMNTSSQSQTEHLDYAYERDDAIDPSRQANFWPQSDPLSAPPRGYLSELYEDRMKLDHSHPESDLSREQGPSPLPYQASPSPHMWQEHHPQGPDHHGSPFPRRTSFPYSRHEGADPMQHASSFLHSEPGSFLGSYSTRSDAFYGEPISMHDHVGRRFDPI